MSATIVLVLCATSLYIRSVYVWESMIWTVAAFCMALFLSKVAYQLVLYPRFFSPIRHIQTPQVSAGPHSTLWISVAY